MSTAIAAATIGSLSLVAWHHVGWPLLLSRVARARPGATGPAPALPAGAEPGVAVVMPAHNEAGMIARKIRNLAALDYPADRLRVVLALDGCTDGTAAAARAALAEPGCRRLRCEILDHAENRGKLAALNEALAAVPEEVVALTDVSAMLPPGALRLAAAHFAADPRLGALGGTYRVAPDGLAGEESYWRHQLAVKRGEAALGAPIGLHGAFWCMRRAAWEPLAPDTINDDLVLPMQIHGRGWRVAYDETIVVREAERDDAATDERRRRRIAAGNAQQLARLAWLLHPRHGGVALAFASGKALRVLCPFLIALATAGSLSLAGASALWALAAWGASAIFSLCAAGAALGPRAPRSLAVARYFGVGHAASAVGVARYLLGRDRKPWRRAAAGG